MHTSSLALPPRINPAWRIGIIHAAFHPEIVAALVESAQKLLIKAGIVQSNITFHAVPGSFEIPLIGAVLLEKKEVDALIGLGVIIEGETHHARLIAESVTKGMMDLQIQYGKPFGFEVLYVKTLEQAKARQHKGEEAALAVLWALAEIENVRR
ncbi:MAG: 6,7-dimethyl-8-ribityllumazine synthase [Candidatus Peregrinibacteria bacterium]